VNRVLVAAVPPPPGPRPPARIQRQTRPRLSPDLLAALAARLTPRDRWLLRMLAEHRVLTSVQIGQLAYGAAGTARHRLLRLWRMRAIDRVQPFTSPGTAPMHYVLGDGGASVLAAWSGLTAAQAGYRRDRALAIFNSPILRHTVGTNGVMTALVAAARTRRGCELAAWWPERRCEQQWGDLARPDAYGRWHEDGRVTDFFLEYDTGTEPVAQVAAKISGYTALAEVTGIITPVLFWFPSPAREAHICPALGNVTVPVATATPASGPSPADRVWLMAGGGDVRVRLSEIPASPPVQGRPSAGPLVRDMQPRSEPATLLAGPVPPMPPAE
jgi:Replication-relaxation